MKKIIFTLLLATSVMSFAKAEEPKVKTIFPKQEQKVLVAKKTIQQEEKVRKISLTNKQDISICAVAFNAPVPTNMGALLACLQAISDVVNA